MQKKFERGSENAQMMIDFVSIIQNDHIPEDNKKYWNDVVDNAGKYIDKYATIDYTFATQHMDAHILYLELKHKASKLNIGDRFEHLGKLYEVVGNHGAKFVCNIEKPKGTPHKVTIEHDGKQIECELALSINKSENRYTIRVDEQFVITK